MCTRLVVSGQRLVHRELCFDYLPFVGAGFPNSFAQAPDSCKVHGCSLLWILLAGLLRAEVFVHVALCCASALVRSDSMKSDFAQQCKSVAMNLGVVARSQTACSVLVAVARQC